MPKNSSFTRQDISFLTKQIARSWATSTSEEKEEFMAVTGRLFKDTLRLLEGYSGPSEPKKPSRDGTITISTANMAAMAQVGVGLTLSRDGSSRAVARLLQSLISAGAELFPGQLTLDRRVLLGILVDWTAFVSKLAVAARTGAKES